MISKTVSYKLKIIFDYTLSFFGLIFLFIPLIIILIICSIDTKSLGLIAQIRIGQHGKSFKLYKFKTMVDIDGPKIYVTTANDPRITKLGRFLRKTKLDELPQLLNVLKGEMSLVGPRPDVPGYADRLKGEDRIILQVKPGITGPSSLAFNDEEELLAKQADPKEYNDKVIWPKKIEINKEYIRNYSFKKDIYYLLKTIF